MLAFVRVFTQKVTAEICPVLQLVMPLFNTTIQWIKQAKKLTRRHSHRSEPWDLANHTHQAALTTWTWPALLSLACHSTLQFQKVADRYTTYSQS
jgi:hypothetical protein